MTPHINVHGKQAWLTGRFRLFPAIIEFAKRQFNIEVSKAVRKKGDDCLF